MLKRHNEQVKFHGCPKIARDRALGLAIMAWPGQCSCGSCGRDHAAINFYRDAALQQINRRQAG
jgi:hypothetical protein